MEFEKKYTIHYPPITNHSDTNITVTRTIPQSVGEKIEDRLIVRAGTILPKNDSSAQFVVNNLYDVTDGDAIGSVISMGRILKERLPVAPSTAAIEALAKHGIFVENADKTSRPDFGSVEILEPIDKPVLTDVAADQKFTWNDITDARAYLVYANNRPVATVVGSGTREYVYGDVRIDTNFNVKAIADNLTKGNSELSETLTIKAGGVL